MSSADRTEEIELARETVVRLSKENKEAGDVINQVARALGCMNSDLNTMLSAIERLQKRATSLPEKTNDGSAKSILLEVARALDMSNGYHDIGMEDVLMFAKERMRQLRIARLQCNSPR